jgi:hypothetical protein
MSKEDTETTPLIFTRYLYSKDEVYRSLLIALLDRKYDESLFWTYELYYSGFKSEVFEYVSNIYEEFYLIANPTLSLFIQESFDKWKANPSEDWHIGSIVATLCMRNYNVNVFLEHYCNVKCLPKHLEKTSEKTMIVRLKPTNIEKYKTKIPTPEKTRFYLPEVCQYSIHKEVNNLFQTPEIDIRDKYRRHWLYYAARSPVWEDRLVEFDAIVNDEDEEIEFDNDDIQDAFYDKWGIEPDEQKIEVQEKSIGTGKELQLSIKDFCEKYGSQLITKTVKIKINKPLTNSLVCT